MTEDAIRGLYTARLWASMLSEDLVVASHSANDNNPEKAEMYRNIAVNHLREIAGALGFKLEPVQ